MIGYGSNKGIVPIACEQIFKRMSKSETLTYEVQVSMLEIYNEKVQDLLIDSNQRPPSGLKVRENKLLGPYVEGLTKYPVTSYDEISRKMEEGNDNRTIGSTLMNATSSRAHTIITIEFKQIESIPGKPKSEKISVINLVDLAGSERSSSTGATGSRLKEGCNINKSLLVLGNVINTLADKAMGKNKNMLPPYRDSVLTRILQSALGGNSKTVMICALSPADINYEETLSTLRYADRAKKIQNKAIINESENDKLVRLLKEENQDLKKRLDSVLSSIGIGGGVVSQEDKLKLSELKEEYDANMKLMESMEKSFEQKLDEAKKQEKIGDSIDRMYPHLVVINEDSQLSHKLKYSLKETPVYVGRKQGNPKPKIILSGYGIKVNHVKFDIENKKIKLIPTDPSACDHIFINGIKLETNSQGVLLNHMDKIIFGLNTYLLYLEKSDGQELYNVDYEQMLNQQQEEAEKENEKMEQEKEKQKILEMEQIKSKMEEKFLSEKKQMENNLKKQLEEYEVKLKSVSNVDEKDEIKKKKTTIQHILCDEEIVKAIQLNIAENNEKNTFIKFNVKGDNEIIHKSEKNETNMLNNAKKLIKTRELIKTMNRNLSIDLLLQKPLDSVYFYNKKFILKNQENDSFNILFRVENFEIGEVYYWTQEIFNNRYAMLVEHYEDNQDDYDDGKKVEIKNHDDPFWDSPKQSLIGNFFISLKSILYNIPISTSTKLFSSINNKTIGKVDFKIEMGQMINNIFTPNSYDFTPSFDNLQSKTVSIKLNFEKIHNFTPNLFNEKIFLEYYAFGDIKKHIAEIEIDKNESIDLKYSIIHNFTFNSSEDYDYINEESIVVNLYSIEKTHILGLKENTKNNPINTMKLQSEFKEYKEWVDEERVKRGKTITNNKIENKDEAKKDDKCNIM